MKMNSCIQLVFLFVVNAIFTLSGIVSNILVIVSIWKSSQLRKKLCYFMIMVLSCFDLVALITNHPVLLLYLIFWLKEDYDLFFTWRKCVDIASVFVGLSFLALLVMSIERYLGAYHPIFHRTSITRRRLLTLLGILVIFSTTCHIIISTAIDMIIARILDLIYFTLAIFLPLLYLNFKLFKISREVRRRNETSPEKRTKIDLKSISTCLLVVACLVLSSIPAVVYIVYNLSTENKQASNTRLSHIWVTTIFTMNCTLNSSIFFWKNKVLRTEGIKMLKTFKDKLFGS